MEFSLFIISLSLSLPVGCARAPSRPDSNLAAPEPAPQRPPALACPKAPEQRTTLAALFKRPVPFATRPTCAAEPAAAPARCTHAMSAKAKNAFKYALAMCNLAASPAHKLQHAKYTVVAKAQKVTSVQHRCRAQRPS